MSSSSSTAGAGAPVAATAAASAASTTGVTPTSGPVPEKRGGGGGYSGGPPNLEAIKTRVITHMNKDHSLSLYDYINYYKSDTKGKDIIDPDHPSSSIEMTNIENDKITIKYSTKSIAKSSPQIAEIPIEPPMQSISESRVVLVKMATEAAQSRGYATHRISEYLPIGSTSNGVRDILITIGLLITVVPLIRSTFYNTLFAYILPDSINPYDFYTAVPILGPIFHFFLEDYPWAAAIICYSIHIGEALFIMRPKLIKYRVPEDQRKSWYIANIIEGYPALQRINKLIKKIEERH